MKKENALFESRFPGLPAPTREGCRDIYDLGDRLLLVETDRIGAGGQTFPNSVPDKGRVVASLNKFWLDFSRDIVPNHLISRSVAFLSLPKEEESALVGRSLVVKKTVPIPYDFLVAGHMTPSLWEEYRAGGTAAGVPLPEGLAAAGKLHDPFFAAIPRDGSAPGADAAFRRLAGEIGAGAADRLKAVSLELYAKAAAHAQSKGIIIAETRFSFGFADGEVTLTGDVLSTESSLYWPAGEWMTGRTPPSYEKRFLLGWLESEDGRKPGAPLPAIPDRVARATHGKYIEAGEKIIGQRLVFSQKATGFRQTRRRFGQAAVLAAARVFVFFVSLLPFGPGRWLGRRIGDLWRTLDGRHRRRAERQVAERLGMDPAGTRDFVRRNFHSYGMTLVEFAMLSRARVEDFPRHIDFDGFEEFIRPIVAEGRGLMFITGHFGNWEWCNSTARHLGLTGGSIARPLDNPGLNEFVRSIRERNGLAILDKRGAVKKARELLLGNHLVGVLIDQDAGPQGMMSPFLGKPASTISIPVEIALRTGSPMIAVALRRGGAGGKAFTMLYSREVRRVDAAADPAAEIRRLVDILNDDLGKIIMQAPDQWFWTHQRWKSAGRR